MQFLPQSIRMMSSSPIRPKISLIGSGQIGSILGLLAGIKQLGSVQFFDIAKGIPEGKALDLNQLTAVEKLPTKFSGSTSYEDIRGSSVAIITAGVPRKPGMSRTDLLKINSKVIMESAEAVKTFCPEAFVICITNPLDAMVQLFQEKSQLPAARVVGMAGVLDSARFSYFLSEKLQISVDNIQSIVLGGHGDSMVPILRYTTVAGIPLTELIQMKYITENEVKQIVDRTRFGGQEIVEFLKTGSAFYTPAASAIQMAEAYLYDKKMILPCAVKLNGEYGVKGYYAGVPAIIGAKGVEKVIQLVLTKQEMEAFEKSVHEVKKIVSDMQDLIAKP